MLSNGRARPADIKIELRNGVSWILVKDLPLVEFKNLLELLAITILKEVA